MNNDAEAQNQQQQQQPVGRVHRGYHQVKLSRA